MQHQLQDSPPKHDRCLFVNNGAVTAEKRPMPVREQRGGFQRAENRLKNAKEPPGTELGTEPSRSRERYYGSGLRRYALYGV